MEVKSNENKEYYGILMNKKNLDGGIYSFIPECFIKGYIEKDGDDVIFYDELENSYITFTDPSASYSEIERVIGYLISKEELIKRNPNLSLEQAKIKYYNDIADCNHFGVLDLVENKIKVISIDLYDLVSQTYSVENTLDYIEIDFNTDEELELNDIKADDIEQIVENTDKNIDINDMKLFFDKKIISQEEAKKRVISTFYMNMLSNNQVNKKSCLLVGPTGSGKTLIAETLGEYLDVPVVSIDTTQLTAPGYIGAKIEDFLIKLISKANGNLEVAEHGIVILDEIDKKGSEKNYDVTGRAVLNNLLPFIEGTTYRLKYNNCSVEFDTSNLCIFATGAFTEVAKAKSINNYNNMYSNTNIGFNKNVILKDDNQDIKYEHFEIEDFVKYGNMPEEFMGRFTSIVQLNGHTVDTLKSILLNSSISPLLTEKETLAKIGVDLNWTEGYINEVAKQAIKLKTGARSLKNTVENSIEKVRWEVLTKGPYSAIILTEKTVNDNNCFVLLDSIKKDVSEKKTKKKIKTKE